MHLYIFFYTVTKCNMHNLSVSSIDWDIRGHSSDAMGVVGVSAFSEKSVMKVQGSTLLALQGGGWGVKFPGKSVT